MKNSIKLIRITTIPLSLEKLLGGQLGFMKDFYEVVAVSSDKEQLKVVGMKEGVRIKEVHLTRQITPIQDLKALFKMYKVFKKEKPQIVHTHTPKAGVIGMLAAKFSRVPNRLHTVAGLPLLEAKGFKKVVLNFVEKLTYCCATKVYPNSYGLKSIILENNFVNKNKLKVIANGSSNGIDTSFFNPNLFSEGNKQILKNELKIQKDDFVFIFVGRIVGDKGINELVNAFDDLSANNNNVKLLLVGPFEEVLDPLKMKTLKIIEDNKKIIVVGYQRDVRPYFSISNCLVFPSYREGFPNVVMQAGAMGLPSIVSNINGCNEIIEENKNGLIIPVKNQKAINQAMNNIMINNSMKNNAREMITSRFEQIIVWKALLNEYKSLENNV